MALKRAPNQESKEKKHKGEIYSELALRYAVRYKGKIEIAPKVPVRDLDDFSIWYTPGVAAVCRAIKKDPRLSFEYTGRWNTIAIVSDGSRVLGLGNVGPEAAMPVMEGKSLIFKYLGGVDAIPLVIDVHEPDGIVEWIKKLEPSVSGINLEDIASPKCFHILDTLRNKMNVPVWHDDQQGTAAVTLAALINALTLTNRKLSNSKTVLFGAGAANIATARLLIEAGADPGRLVVLDSEGILYAEREDIDQLMLKHRWKYDLAIKTNKEHLHGDLNVALNGADVLIAASTPGPGVIKPHQIKRMNSNPIVFLEANPVPEMWPWQAADAGAAIVATGRSDFPNQVNNSLMFPAVFRGVLEVRAKTVTDSMIIAGAQELARYAQERGLSKDYIIPTMEQWEVYPRVAAAVGTRAVKEGLARRELSREQIQEHSQAMIERSRQEMSTLVSSKIVDAIPEEVIR